MTPYPKEVPNPMPSRAKAQLSAWPGLLLGVAMVCGSTAFCQPRLIAPPVEGYGVGDLVDPGTLVLDKDLQPKTLKELIKPETELVVLVLFGADFKSSPGEDHRGPFWCEDSFDDLAVQRALFHAFKDRPVQFIPVAVPPVYNPSRYGWTDNVFLDQPDDSEAFLEAARGFVERTEGEIRSGLIPFPEVYYDPKFRLAQNKKERELGPGFGKIYDWQGKLKWRQDGRKYGTPTIWLLGKDGRVLTEPLFGNDYDSDPPEIHYEFNEAKEMIEGLLDR